MIHFEEQSEKSRNKSMKSKFRDFYGTESLRITESLLGQAFNLIQTSLGE